MGILMGKLKKQKNAEEVLLALDKEIKTIEEYRRNTEQSHKRIVGRFIIISVGIYLVSAFIFYFYFFPATFYDRLYYIIPLILAPVILVSVKRVLNWFYNWKLTRKQNKLVALRDQKKKILDNVMDNEKYKVAKSILEKFAPELVSRKNNLNSDIIVTPLKQPSTPSLALTPFDAPNSGLRQRQSLMPLQTPSRPIPMSSMSTVVARPGMGRVQTNLPPMGAPVVVPKNILPRDRSVLDRMVDYLVGDGPSNRYALICSHCCSHNGMVFPEEFEYTSYRCCYCYTFNPARKKRPIAPKLEFEGHSSRIKRLSETSESEKNSASDTDSETDHNKALAVQEVPSTDVDNKASTQEEPKSTDVDNVVLVDQEVQSTDVEGLESESSIENVPNEDEEEEEVVAKALSAVNEIMDVSFTKTSEEDFHKESGAEIVEAKVGNEMVEVKD